ncbi:MAG TPA: hypothetical protein VJ697_00700 [Nitrososphaeraceae archaeon]|nr:hypothetical protein [Nitrososphaeraceae archaeon]
MKIIVDEETEKIYLKRFNISIDKVICSIENPDSKKIVNIQNFKLISVLKKFDNYYLLINGRIDTDTEIKIDRVFIIGEHLLKNISIENPLEIIEQFANEFGYQLEIANHTGKFIQNVKLKILANRHTSIKKKILYNTLITADDGRIISGTGLLSLCADSKIIDGIEHIDIFFFFCISLNKYMYHLKTNKLI